MPRSSRRSAPPRRAPPARPASTKAPAPQPRSAAPPAMQQPSQSGGLLSGMLGGVAQGFAFGTGSAIAHRAVGAVANSVGGGSSSAAEKPAPEHGAYEQQTAAPVNPCEFDQVSFYQCLQSNNGDLQACSALHDALQACQINLKQQQQFM